MDKQLAIECIRKRYEHEPCLSYEERARHIDVDIKRVMGDALASSATIAPDAVKTFGGISPTTIITEPVLAENSKQREITL